MLSKSKIKYVRSLQLKKFRQKYQSYVVEGPKIMDELLKSNSEIHTIFSLPSWAENNASIINDANFETFIVDVKELRSISMLKNPQDVLAIIGIPEAQTPDYSKGIHLVLDSISDPGNMGTIIRSADWFNANIVCSEDCVDIYNPKVVQASMGSVARVPIQYRDLIEFLNESPLPSYATVLDGQEISQLKLEKNANIIIGNEAHGIQKDLVSACDYTITIPSLGKAESLNAAIACSIVLFSFRN